MIIQWIFSNEVGDEKYHHTYALRKYTLQPGLSLEDIPFHNHNYVQSPYILSGCMRFENEEGESVEAGPGDTVFFTKANATGDARWETNRWNCCAS